jgi:hypothetical protein
MSSRFSFRRLFPIGFGIITVCSVAWADDLENKSCQVVTPSGATIELLGLCDQPSQDQLWWRADGSPIPADSKVGTMLRDNAPKETGFKPDRTGDLVREAVLRLFPVLEATIVGPYVLEPAGTVSTGSTWDRKDSAKIIAFSYLCATIRPAARTSIFFDYSDEPWQPYATYTPADHTKADAHDMVVLFSEPVEKGGMTSISVVHDEGQPNEVYRLVAVDVAHKMHLPSRQHGQGSKGNHGFISMSYVEFESLPLSRLREIQLQYRRLHHVEFRNVSLHRGQKSHVEVFLDQQPYKSPEATEQAPLNQRPNHREFLH